MSSEILKGSYCLLITLECSSKIQVGKKGLINFRKGYYVYVGSALNSMIPRILRHLSDQKKLHWHIDYLLKEPNAIVLEVMMDLSGKDLECNIASLISEKGEKVDGFGCSDCYCPAHLFYFKQNKDAKNSIKKAFNKLNLELKTLNDLKI